MIELRLATLSGDPDREAELAGKLGSEPGVNLVFRCVDRVEMVALLRSGGVDAVMSIGAPAWLDPASIDEAARANVRILGVTDDPLEADRLMTFGVEVASTKAPMAELVRLCRITEVPPPPPPRPMLDVPRQDARVVAVWGSKGAPGRSTVAIELAFELSDTDPATLLIDADPFGGDLLQLLGVVEELPTVVWAAHLAGKDELSPDRLVTELRRVGKAGPVLLPGLPRPDLWADVSTFGWRRLIEVARSAFKYTVVDVGFSLESQHEAYSGFGEGRNRMTLETLRCADRIVAVVRSDPVGIKAFLWAWEGLDALVDLNDVLIVANRVRKGDQARIGDILRSHTGKRPVAYLPDDTPLLTKSVSDGVAARTVRAGGDLASAIRGAAAAVGGSVRTTGFLARLGARS